MTITLLTTCKVNDLQIVEAFRSSCTIISQLMILKMNETVSVVPENFHSFQGIVIATFNLHH